MKGFYQWVHPRGAGKAHLAWVAAESKAHDDRIAVPLCTGKAGSGYLGRRWNTGPRVVEYAKCQRCERASQKSKDLLAQLLGAQPRPHADCHGTVCECEARKLHDALRQARADLHSLQGAHETLHQAIDERNAAIRERDEARERLKIVEDTLRLAQKWLGRVEWAGEGANEMIRTINMVAAVLDNPHPWAKPEEP